MTDMTAIWLGVAIVTAVALDMVLTGGAGLFHIARSLFGLVEQMRVWD